MEEVNTQHQERDAGPPADGVSCSDEFRWCEGVEAKQKPRSSPIGIDHFTLAFMLRKQNSYLCQAPDIGAYEHEAERWTPGC